MQKKQDTLPRSHFLFLVIVIPIMLIYKAGVTLSNLLHIFSTFYVLDILWWMNKNLLHISLTKFNKLNKRRNRTFLMTHFTFALYSAFIFSTFFSFGGSFDLHLFPYNFFDSKSKQYVVNCMCWVAKNGVLLYDHIYF